MNARDLIGKASRAAVSARLLHDAGDLNGACNRAYYAMFDAARAALINSGAPVRSEVGRTHSGLISAFSLHLVKTGQVPIEYGKALNKVAEGCIAALQPFFWEAMAGMYDPVQDRGRTGSRRGTGERFVHCPWLSRVGKSLDFFPY